MASKVINVRAHQRTIHTRLYKFICRGCSHKAERECYPGRNPVYCTSCRPPKPEKKDNVVQFISSKSLPARLKKA